MALGEEVGLHPLSQFAEARLPDGALELLRWLIGSVIVEQGAKGAEGRILLEFVRAEDNLGIGVRDVLDFGGLVAGETKRGNQSHKLESLLIGHDHVRPFLNLTSLCLFDRLDRLSASTSLAEGSAGSIAGGLVLGHPFV